MTKPRRKKIWDAIFLFRTINPLNTTFEKESLSAMVKGGGGAEKENKIPDFFPLRFSHDLWIEKCGSIPEVI